VVDEEDHESQVVIEVEEVQIQRVNPREADANEFVCKVFDALETDNLPVKFPTVRSRDAPHDHHHRLARLLRLLLTLAQAENPAIAGGIHFRPSPALGKHGRIGQNDPRQCQQGDDWALHVAFLGIGVVFAALKGLAYANGDEGAMRGPDREVVTSDRRKARTSDWF
jgi:hypothetical protein